MERIKFIKRALELAAQNVNENIGGPFGAVVVKDNEIIAEGTNVVTRDNDPTAHAEIVAIRKACLKLKSFQLKGCQIYTSCEPCPMCVGAIYWARPSAVYYAATRFDAAKASFDDSFIYDEINSDPSKRKIPMIKLLPNTSDELLIPFSMWRKNLNKILY